MQRDPGQVWYDLAGTAKVANVATFGAVGGKGDKKEGHHKEAYKVPVVRLWLDLRGTSLYCTVAVAVNEQAAGHNTCSHLACKRSLRSSQLHCLQAVRLAIAFYKTIKLSHCSIFTSVSQPQSCHAGHKC